MSASGEDSTGINIFYGAYKDGSTVLDFDSMVKFGKYAVINNQNADTTCSQASMKIADPLPGVQKQCFSDHYNYYPLAK